VQCVVQGGEEHFADENGLRRHLLEDHKCKQSIVDNYEM
jgi:hypothetical protein